MAMPYPHLLTEAKADRMVAVLHEVGEDGKVIKTEYQTPRSRQDDALTNHLNVLALFGMENPEKEEEDGWVCVHQGDYWMRWVPASAWQG